MGATILNATTSQLLIASTACVLGAAILWTALVTHVNQRIYQRGSLAKVARVRASRPKVHTHRQPFDSASGVWVPATEFGGTKSFGRFACAGCKKSWGSAHAYPQFRQGCQACNQKTKPCCMWVNDSDNRNDRDTDSDEDKAPHDEKRCEACRLGVCDMARRDF